MILAALRLLLMVFLLATTQSGLSADPTHNLGSLERSSWLHASLPVLAQKGCWGPSFPAASAPSEQDVQNAARLLTDTYAANRLYLVYHQEISLAVAEQVFGWWRQHSPAQVQLIPTLVLRMVDQPQTQVFTPDELGRLVEFLQRSLNADHIAIYGVHPRRDQRGNCSGFWPNGVGAG